MPNQEEENILTDIPLEVDLTDVEIDYPVFNAGIYPVRVVGYEQKAKEGAENPNLFVVMKNESVITASNTKKVFNPGEFVFRKYVPSNPTTKIGSTWDWKAAKGEELARLKKAVTGDAKGKFVAKEMVGKVINIKLSISQGTNGTPQNQVDAYLPLNSAGGAPTGSTGAQAGNPQNSAPAAPTSSLG